MKKKVNGIMNKNKEIIIDIILDDIYGEDYCINKDEALKCDTCNHSKECDAEINNEYDHYINNFAEIINYGGYDSSEEFWNEIFE